MEESQQRESAAITILKHEIEVHEAKAREREPWALRLRRDVEHFQSQTKMKFSVIGSKAIKNSRFWDNFITGGTITIEKADEIYVWMASQGFHFNS